MDDNRVPNQLNYKPEGRRNIGRPQTRWEDDEVDDGICYIMKHNFLFKQLFDTIEVYFLIVDDDNDENSLLCD